MPGALDVTVPWPLPAFVSVTVGLWNVALIERVAFMVTVQLAPDTLSHPLQPVKLVPPRGDAVRVTTVPAL
jgi:hypothetical protein